MTVAPSTTQLLTWPPPALEPVHGRLWSAIAILAFGDIVLVPPLLLSLGADRPVGSLGPYGGAFWVPLLTTLLGLIVLLAGLSRLHRLLRGARLAAAAGHARRTILAVMADGTRDTGFLLTGSRAYASLGPTERDTILAARLAAAVLSLSAVLLMPGALGLAIVLGHSRFGGESLLWTLGLWAPLVLCVGAVLAAGGARALAASARRKNPGQKAQARGAVVEWNESLRTLRPDRAPAPRVLTDGKPWLFRLSAWGVVLLAVVVFIPVVSLVVRGTIGAVLASLAVPAAKTRARFAAADALRRFELPPDPSISPQAGGEALQALLRVGLDDAARTPPERRPVRAYAEPWFPRATGTAVLGAAWVDSLFSHPRYAAAQGEYLRRMAAHPAHAEFATVARARNLDVIGTRYDLPFGPGVTVVNLPTPHITTLRDGARAHLALAALQLSDGQPARAEQTIREVISVGFRLLDDGPNLIDNLAGVALIDLGGEALERFERSTGRSRDADALQWAWSASRQAAERTAAGEPRLAQGDVLRAMSRVVLDSTQARGIRWDFFGWTAVFAPCSNIRAAAFGPGEDYAAWLDSARTALVRRPSDQALLELSLKGPFGNGGCMPLWGGLRTIGQMR